ncbi:hypothetical protein [Chryseobacterium indologenes]|uniref:Uncharacterized protein n=1 Tax=Chryseobacterium indologenes TaxID=253 RepID=A0A0N0IW85_CHRID|nr:hypothetical protein [Chryseobacterium indologenes]KPE51122.1 hypothetical protein AOB46_10635 [Chryseobacterium indologenes]
MGQDITCLIINKKLDLGKEVVHFEVNDFTFVPFNMSCPRFEGIENFDQVSDYIRHLESEDDFESYPYDRDNDHCEVDIFKMIRDHQLENFIIEHSSEWADMPVDYCFMQVLDGRIIKNPLVNNENQFTGNNFENIKEAKKNFGLNFDWLAMYDLFHSYPVSDRAYTLIQAKK